MTDSQSAPGPASPHYSFYFTVILVLLSVAAAAAYYAYVLRRYAPAPIDELQTLHAFISRIPQSQNLAESYLDADGDLVADTPADPTKLQNVDEIGFSMIAGDDPERTRAEWMDFLVALEKATGTKVVLRTDVGGLQGQLAALRKGTLHVTAFSTGEVPLAVNSAGFVPLWSPADVDGTYAYEMEILVPAASNIKTPADLRGRSIAFTSLSSNSGARAPLVILKEKFGLLPARDYAYTLTGTHERSLKDLAEGRHDAVCVANDLVARAVLAGDLKPEQFRSIYKSASFPPLCLGVAHDLPPDLVAKMKQMVQGFRFEGTSLEKRFLPQGKVKLAVVNYQRDWAYVRDIDQALTRLLDGK